MKIIIVLLFINSMAFARDFKPAISLAQRMIDSALIPGNSDNIDEMENFKVLKSAFNNPFKFKIKKCDYYAKVSLFDFYDAFSKNEKLVNRITICKGQLRDSDELMAQTLIHEVAHLSLKTTEQESTKFELLAAFYHGVTPIINGYVRPIEISKNKLTKEELKYLNYLWMVEMDMATKKDWIDLALIGYSTFREKDSLLMFLEHPKLIGKYDINLQDQYGMTPLMFAAREGVVHNIKSLIKFGADKHLQNIKGQTALDIAIEYNRLKSIKILRK